MIIRPATEADAEQFVNVVRSGLNESLLGATIYGAHGISRYIVGQLTLPHGLSDTQYTVADINGRVAGCVEMRRVSGSLFLNYIFVLPECRTLGLGKSLLREALKSAQPGASTLVLDVFADNPVARAWYERLGFHTTYSMDWLSLMLPPGNGSDATVIVGYPQAQAVHERYGFSQFTVITDQGEYAVGRLGDQWFRLTQATALQDTGLLSALSRLDAHRRILALVKTGAADSGEQTEPPVFTSHRMVAPVSQVMGKVSP